MTTTAKVFRNGGSQAVRLPSEFRFDTDEVLIKRVGAAVVLLPAGAAWDLMATAIGKADEDFLPDRDQPSHAQQRRPL